MMRAQRWRGLRGAKQLLKLATPRGPEKGKPVQWGGMEGIRIAAADVLPSPSPMLLLPGSQQQPTPASPTPQKEIQVDVGSLV